jgi:formylglycine-generating enzyme required for sulfatase activity
MDSFLCFPLGGASCRASSVSKIFLSHSNENNAQAIALSHWLEQEGWNDIFLDVHLERGFKAGERWEEALRDAADRCEAVLFLLSRAWLSSEWCRDEFRLARHLRRRLFPILIEDIPINELPAIMTRDWQVIDITPVGDTKAFSVTLPRATEPMEVSFGAEGLHRLKLGLFSAGLDARFFKWPPDDDLNRPPYRGLLPLEAEDAGIFFGRDAPIVEALYSLRGLRESPPPRLLVILGASGSGKSSFLRSGLLPRLQRDDRNFLPLQVVRPQHAPISGETGFLSALEGAFASAGIAIARAELRTAILDGASKLKLLLRTLSDKATPKVPEADANLNPPTIVISIDQAEELFLAEAKDEAQPFLALLRELLNDDAPAVIAIFTIRSDNYERLQLAKDLEGVHQETLSLPPMPKGSYAEVIKGPARRLQSIRRALEIEDTLVDALLADIEAGGAKDNLPLLAFTLERLFLEYGGRGRLALGDYEALGRIKGSIEAAIERALKAADADPAIPRDRAARLALLRRGLIPWLAGIDPDTGAPRRRVARLSEIPVEARPLIQHLVEQHLLATDVNKDTGEATIEPAHEALLRQWGLLEGWLTEDAGLLAVLEGVKRASRDWAANNRGRAWLTHASDRLAAAERLSARPDLANNLEPTDRDYIAACREAEREAEEKERAGRRTSQRMVASLIVLLAGVIVGLVGWINQATIADKWRFLTVTWPYERANVRPYILSTAKEQALKPGDSFKECAQDCPEMMVVPARSYTMGGPTNVEGSPHTVTFTKPFAVSKYEVTFADWDACVTGGGCSGYRPNDEGWVPRGTHPVINVNWDDAQQYVAWLSSVTGKPYRLLTDAEYEYAARGGVQPETFFPWGDDIKINGQAMANCDGCGSKWDSIKTAPIGSFPPNKFGLYDMVGNVFEWTEDCFHHSYKGAPSDGSAWLEADGGDCSHRVVRGGSWGANPRILRSATRLGGRSDVRDGGLGFRVGRTLLTP